MSMLMPRSLPTKILADNELVTDNQIILRIFGYRCIMCRRMGGFVHEIVPRSICPVGWERFDNRVPLCGSCHNFVHASGTRNHAEELREKRREFLKKHYADYNAA
jgi:hypothetical protein